MPNPAAPTPAADVLASLWLGAAMPADALPFAELPGSEPVLPSSFAVATAAQATLAAAALAAAETGHRRGQPRQRVTVGKRDAALEARGWFSLDGRVPEVWDKLSGLYRCGDGGWVRIHANFPHHRDGALALLGCTTGPGTGRDAVTAALQRWRAADFEAAAADAGLVVAAARSFDDWDVHPQAVVLRRQPLVHVERIDGAQDVPPNPLPALPADAAPLAGLRVLELTRILAGPVAGRTLAAYGAEVMLVNSPKLPNIEAIADTSRGKLSAHVDLDTAEGRATLQQLVRGARVFVQGYRPGALASRGFAPQEVARLAPGIVCVSLSAYGGVGPWGTRRGFDSLVQTATGFNLAEAAAFGAPEPKALPMQILDYGAGYLLAFGALVALARQAAEGGSWHVQISLAGVGHWLRTLGRVADGPRAPKPLHDDLMADYPGGFGHVKALRHAAVFERTPARWARPAMPPGTHPPRWP